MSSNKLSMNDAYNDVYKNIIEHGINSKPRGLSVKEIINYSFMLSNPTKNVTMNVTRAMNLKYAIGELCFYLAGSNDVHFIREYSKFWERLTDDGTTVNSAYGKILLTDFNHLGFTPYEYCVSCLLKDPDTRKAVMPIYNHEVNGKLESNDNPCTMYLQFFIRAGKLHLIVNMRSNDIYLGLPYDVFFFTIVQQMMYVRMKNFMPKLKLGVYFHNAGSMHLYLKDIDKKQYLHTKNQFSDISNEDEIFRFKDLLMAEKIIRLKGKEAYQQQYAILKTTPFQKECIDILMED